MFMLYFSHEKIYNLTDQQFVFIAPLLQESRDPRVRKLTITDGHALERIFNILCDGCRWWELPQKFGQWIQVFMRYKR